MTTKEVLIQARKLIENKDNWYGVDNPRNKCYWRRCAEQAINRAGGVDEWPKAIAAFKFIVGEDISAFNASHTHAEVLDAFDRAIAAVAYQLEGLNER